MTIAHIVGKVEAKYLLSLYVNDILLAVNDMDIIKKTKSYLNSRFEMKDIEETSYVLEIKITGDQDARLLYLDQSRHLKKMLERFKMHNYKVISILINEGQHLDKSMSHESNRKIIKMRNIPYTQAVISLMYAITSTRPGICYVVGLISQFQFDPGQEHWCVIKRIFKYLQGTNILKICFEKDDLKVLGFRDVDLLEISINTNPLAVGAFLFGGAIVSWSSKK